MDFICRAPALLNPFSHQTVQTHYLYNPLHEGYHTLVRPGDCTSSLLMEAHKLVFLGDLKVGDTRFIQHLGSTEDKTITIDGRPCKICMYEIASLDEDEAAYQYIRGAGGVIYFYNSASRLSYEHIIATHDKLQKIRAASTTSALDPAISSVTSPPSVLIGFVPFRAEREVSLEEGKELARKLGCKFSFETEDTIGDVLGRMIRSCREARKAQGASWWSWGTWGSCLGRGE